MNEAEALVDQVITQDPKNTRAHFLKAKFYLARNEGANAIPGFRMMVEEHPEEVDGHMNLARAHILNGEYELAANVLEKAIEKLPGEEALLVALVRLNVMRQDKGAVEATLKRALRVHPENSRIGISLGDFYMSEGRYKDALSQYQYVVEKQPDEAAGYVKTASAYQYLKQPEEALAQLEEGYRRIPDSGLLLTRLAKWYIDANSPETAKKLSLDHLEKNPASQEAWMVLADLYVKENDFEKAAANLCAGL
jgi:cytochrome c-type biogenesis protein CcmH/NrfG